MGVLADWQIQREGIITPFADGRLAKSSDGTLTSGVGHYGYDVRCSHEFQIFEPVYDGDSVIDPKNFNPRLLKSAKERHTKNGVVVIPPHSFALTQTVERLNIPRSILATVLGKSTYARCGIIVNVTPLEPEWQGHITIEISNTTPMPAMIYPGEGIAQVLFHRADGYTQVLLDELVDRLTEQYKLTPHCSSDARLRAEEDVQKLLDKSGCKVSYADKKGRYQNQGDKVVLPCASGSVPQQTA